MQLLRVGELVGRAPELELLDQALTAALGGRRQTVLLGGEPGIGKTQLLAAWSDRAAAAGARLYWGRCREEGGAPVHWPWVQIIRAQVRGMEPDAVAAALGGDGAVLAAAVPELSAGAGRGPLPGAADRFVFFDAMQAFLRRLAADTPLVLIFDDLHAADASSLALLEFISAELTDARLLLLGTYRVHEAAVSEAAPVLTRIARHGQRVQLRGLSVEDVGRVLAAHFAAALPAAQIGAIHSATDGNPLFVQEVARALALRDELGTARPHLAFELPASVEHVLASRLASLPAAAREMLGAAAVIGRSFDIATLEAVTGTSAMTLLEHLQSAVDTAIVEMRGGSRGEAIFAHAVHREFFYAGLPLAQRAALHLTIARVLDEQGDDARLPDIAHHFLAAGPVADPDAVVEALIKAGAHASARLAYAQAAQHYAAALRALDRRARDDARRCDLLLRLGEMRYRAGDGQESKRILWQAAGLARDLNDGERLGRVALALAGPWVLSGGGVRDDIVQLFEHALAAGGATNDALRVLLLARLAIELQFSDTSDRPLRLADEAEATARRVGVPVLVDEALIARCAALYRHRGNDDVHERFQVAREAVDLTRRIGQPELDFRARFNFIFALLHLGDRHSLESELATVAQLAAHLRQPVYDWIVAVWQAMRATIDGRLSEAETLTDAAFNQASRTLSADELRLFAVQVYRAQTLVLRRDTGRELAELLPIHRQIAEVVPIPLAHIMVVLLQSDLQDWHAARDGFERFASDFASIPPDSLWLLNHVWLAEICASLGDRPRARQLYDILRPHAREHVSNGNTYMGSTSYYLGLLAAADGRAEDAAAHFVSAQRQHRRMGARCWITRTQLHHGALLLQQAAGRDRHRGRAMLEEALARAREMGMAGVVPAAERLLASAPDRVSHRPAEAPVERERCVFSRRGHYWLIAFDGESIHLKDQKGLAYLQELLRRPGREVHVLDLMHTGNGTGTAHARAGEPEVIRTQLGDAGPLLDARSTAEYRRRLEDLRTELRAAEAHNDIGLASRLGEEIAFLGQELSGAARGRRAASHAERARVTLNKGIAAAMKKIAAAHPALGRHLKATVRTGYFCSYTPDPRLHIDWSM